MKQDVGQGWLVGWTRKLLVEFLWRLRAMAILRYLPAALALSKFGSGAGAALHVFLACTVHTHFIA
jgi:hypothetical protein